MQRDKLITDASSALFYITLQCDIFSRWLRSLSYVLKFVPEAKANLHRKEFQ